jgi:hypothetical protein
MHMVARWVWASLCGVSGSCCQVPHPHVMYGQWMYEGFEAYVS